MKKIWIGLALFGAVLFNIGCGNSGGNPKNTLIAFFEALGKKDIESAKKLATKDSKALLDMMEMGMKMSKDSKDMDKFNKEKMTFGEPKIEGDKATIAVTEKDKNETLNFTLKKEEGTWKVAFDKASLMEMGMQKMKEEDPESLEKMKNINLDSVTEKMKEKMENSEAK